MASGPPLPTGPRLTAPAWALARARGCELTRLPTGELVTEARLKELLAAGGPATLTAGDRRLIIYGGGGHGKAVIEAVRAMGTYEVVGVVDDDLPRGSKIIGLPVLGGAGALAGLLSQGIRLAANGVGGIGDPESRIRVFRSLLEAGFFFPPVIHPTAFIEPSAGISPGVQVMPLAYVGSEVEVGFGVLINSSAVVSHDCRLQAYANLSPGALLAGGVRLGEAVQIGMGATINLGVAIGDQARVGNSAVVKKDVPSGGIVRAGAVWPERGAKGH
jgi:sugar O-acyltransferase (sialic acid O-acetyltransferase NeuD family)